METPDICIQGRRIGLLHEPLVIAEIGINHDGDVTKAQSLVIEAKKAGAECVKFQCHIPEDEMIENEVVPPNASETIWSMMQRCALSEEADRALKAQVEALDMLYLSTPFSRAAADRLQALGVEWFKIGSGECNNLPLVEHVARFGKPMIVSTGMNDLSTIGETVKILRGYKIPFALLHCTSCYPTRYEQVRLGALVELQKRFPDAVIGLSDHSLSNYPSFGAVAFGASIIERHFTVSKSWPGPDIEISMDPQELSELLEGSHALFLARGGEKTVLPEEKATIQFAFASVVSIQEIKAGDTFSSENIWVKRPGTGELMATEYASILGMRASRDIPNSTQLRRSDILS